MTAGTPGTDKNVDNQRPVDEPILSNIQAQVLIQFFEERRAETWNQETTCQIINWLAENRKFFRFTHLTLDRMRQCLNEYLSVQHRCAPDTLLSDQDNSDEIEQLMALTRNAKLFSDDIFCSSELPNLLSKAIEVGSGAVSVIEWVHNTFNRKNVFLHFDKVDGLLPLHRAILKGNMEAALAILAVGEECSGVRLPDRRGLFALHLACECGHLEMVRALIAHMISDKDTVDSIDHDKNCVGCLYQRSGDGRIPVLVAAEGRHWPIVLHLIALDLQKGKHYGHILDTRAGQNLLHYVCYFTTALVPVQMPIASPVSGANASSRSNAFPDDAHPPQEDFEALRLEVVDLLLHSYSNNLASCGCKQGYLPLHIAAQQGDGVVVEKLCQQREAYYFVRKSHFDSDDTTVGGCLQAQNGRTPLHFACQSGSVAAVRALLELNKSFCIPKLQLDLVQTAGLDRRLPLHLAAFGGSAAIVELLLAHYPEACTRTVGNNLTPLHIACSHGHYECALLLLGVSEEPVFMSDTHVRDDAEGNASSVEHSDNYPITLAIRNQHWTIVLYLLTKYPRLVTAVTTPQSGITFFHLVAHNFQPLAVISGDNTSTSGCSGASPVSIDDNYNASTDCDAIRVCRLAVQKIWDLALVYVDWTVSREKIRSGLITPQSTAVSNAIVNEMKEESALPMRPDALGYTPLHMACSVGDRSFVRFLLDSYDGIKATSVTTTDAGSRSCCNGNGSSVSASVSLSDSHCHLVSQYVLMHQANNGRSAMHFAAQNKHEAVLWLLTKRLSPTEEVGLRSNDGRLPLHLAVYHKDSMPLSTEMVAKLGANGASVATAAGYLPLHLACMIDIDWKPTPRTGIHINSDDSAEEIIDKKIRVAQVLARIYPQALVSYCGTDQFAELPLHIAIKHRCWTLARWLFDAVALNLREFVHGLESVENDTTMETGESRFTYGDYFNSGDLPPDLPDIVETIIMDAHVHTNAQVMTATDANLEPADDLLCNFVNLESRNSLVHVLASVSLPPADILTELEAIQLRSLIHRICSYRAHTSGIYTTNVDGHTAFHLACHTGNYIVLEELLRIYFRRCAPNLSSTKISHNEGQDTENSISMPDWQRDLEERYLQEDILGWETVDHMTALHLVAQNGSLPCVSLLMHYYARYRVAVSACNSQSSTTCSTKRINNSNGDHLATKLTARNGMQALHLAAEHRNYDIVLHLLCCANSGYNCEIVKHYHSESLCTSKAVHCRCCLSSLINCRVISPDLCQALYHVCSLTTQTLLHFMFVNYMTGCSLEPLSKHGSGFESKASVQHTPQLEAASFLHDFVMELMDLYLRPCTPAYTDSAIPRSNVYSEEKERLRVKSLLSLLYCSQMQLASLHKRRQLIPAAFDIDSNSIRTSEGEMEAHSVGSNTYVPPIQLPLTLNPGVGVSCRCIYFAPVDNLLAPPYSDMFLQVTSQLVSPYKLQSASPASGLQSGTTCLSRVELVSGLYKQLCHISANSTTTTTTSMSDSAVDTTADHSQKQVLRLNLESPRLVLIRRVLRLTTQYVHDAEHDVWTRALADWFPELNLPSSVITPFDAYNSLLLLCREINWSYRRLILLVANRMVVHGRHGTNSAHAGRRNVHLTRSDITLDFLLRVKQISASCVDIWSCILCFL